MQIAGIFQPAVAETHVDPVGPRVKKPARLELRVFENVGDAVKTRRDVMDAREEIHRVAGPPVKRRIENFVSVLDRDHAVFLVAENKLREQDIFVPAIRYPTVARGKARLRVT